MRPSTSSGSTLGQQCVNNYRHRHNPDKIARLEEIFNECAHPDESRRRQISEELGLDAKQVKFWFQNKKTQLKTLNERLDNHVLRLDNARLQSENHRMSETLKNLLCVPCGGQVMGVEERELSLQILRAQNFLLNTEASKLSYLIDSLMMLLPPFPSSHDTSQGSLQNQMPGIPVQNQFIPSQDHHIHAQNQLVPPHDHHIHACASHQYTPVVTTPAIDQNIPAHHPDIHHLTSSSDYNIPGLSTTLAQNIPTLISTCKQNNNIPVVEQEIQEPNHGIINILSLTLDQDMPPLGRDIPAINQYNMPHLDLDAIVEIRNNDMLMRQSTNTEDALMLQIANNAMEELMKLLSMNEPFWFRSLHDGKFILQHESYQKTFPWSDCLRAGPHSRIESSKDLRVVSMSGTQLVEMFLNSDKWVDLFPTIVKKAQTIQVFESGLLGNRNGALQLMNAEMHILSHLVPTREFLFLRYCKQIEAGVWVIGDVSLDSSKYKTSVSQAWRLPSGCLIQEMTQGLCRVSWVEHVNVDDNIQTHEIFKDIIHNNAYGAERWVSTLERMCERFACASVETIPSYEAGGVIRSLEGRKSIIKLAHRMVKTFCGNLDMQGDTNFPHLTKMNDDGIRLSVHVNNTKPNAPKGMILGAATTFRLPFSPQNVFDYLIDNKERPKWDVLCCGNEGCEIQRISTGINPGNYISIMQSFIPRENNIMILQESYVDALGSMLVYAPFDTEIMNGQSNVPEGQDGQIDKSAGSLVTLMFQLLASSPSKLGMVDIEFVGVVKTLVTSTVEKIKVALNCTNLK
uniref:Homeobox-leucine zipper protein HDG12 n=1 Tax=Cajanus cajan TaxID=3821 RepID=A0A151S696_CAJCA|nr:Homeobox-leucine zipper protein HDG12 [Cajanus cajan]